jgi:hypothetical protein
MEADRTTTVEMTATVPKRMAGTRAQLNTFDF